MDRSKMEGHKVDENLMKSILGMDLKMILVEKLTACQRGDGWKYLCAEPVLHFKSRASSERPVYWVLSWRETEEGDDQLLIAETSNTDSLSNFQRVDGFREPVIAGSSIHLENATVQRVFMYGYKDVHPEFLTSIVLELRNVYVTCISGPVFTVTVSNTFPENLDGELYRGGV